MYLVNAPRYGIEAMLSKEDQTYYAILFMPAMMINLLSGFIFKPLLTTLATRWDQQSKQGFLSIIIKGLGAVGIMSILVALVAYPIGIPVLELLYGIDLTGYRPALMTLLFGGLFNAASVIFYYALVSSRHQEAILPGYAAGAAIAFLFTKPLITKFGIMGAIYLYNGSMIVLTLIFAFCTIYFIVKASHSSLERN